MLRIMENVSRGRQPAGSGGRSFSFGGAAVVRRGPPPAGPFVRPAARCDGVARVCRRPWPRPCRGVATAAAVRQRRGPTCGLPFGVRRVWYGCGGPGVMFSPGQPFRGRPQLRAPPRCRAQKKYRAPSSSFIVVAVTGPGVGASSSLPRPPPPAAAAADAVPGQRFGWQGPGFASAAAAVTFGRGGGGYVEHDRAQQKTDNPYAQQKTDNHTWMSVARDAMLHP